jgi:hypothetical protein
MSERTVKTFYVPDFDDLPLELRRSIEQGARQHALGAKRLWQSKGYRVILKHYGCLFAVRFHSSIVEWCRKHGQRVQ